MRVKTILIFPNGNIAAFGEDGKPIMPLQVKTVVDLVVQYAVDIGYDVSGCEVSMHPIEYVVDEDLKARAVRDGR